MLWEPHFPPTVLSLCCRRKGLGSMPTMGCRAGSCAADTALGSSRKRGGGVRTGPSGAVRTGWNCPPDHHGQDLPAAGSRRGPQGEKSVPDTPLQPPWVYVGPLMGGCRAPKSPSQVSGPQVQDPFGAWGFTRQLSPRAQPRGAAPTPCWLQKSPWGLQGGPMLGDRKGGLEGR